MNQERVSVPRKAVDWLLEATNELDLPFAIKDPLGLLFGNVQPLSSPHPETLEHEGKFWRIEGTGPEFVAGMEASQWEIGTGYLMRFPTGEIIPEQPLAADEDWNIGALYTGAAIYRPIPKPKAVEVSATADESGWFWDRELAALQEAVKATGYVGTGKLRFVPEGVEEGK